eukprot:snap_masked-scaffold_6-processed-gene-3.22-mRNA-1 protein AED:1.00 eAED:1.00 QI:0/0/0/0/1/1/2/0/173
MSTEISRSDSGIMFDDLLDFLISEPPSPTASVKSEGIKSEVSYLSPTGTNQNFVYDHTFRETDQTFHFHTRKCWSREEEICLIGIVFDTFFDRGALLTRDRANHIWNEILDSFQKHLPSDREACKKQEQIFVHRTAIGLQKHYKYMRDENEKVKTKNRFKVLYAEWERYKESV